MATLRVRFDGNVLVPLDSVHLPTDRVLEVEVREPAALSKGSPALLRQAMRNPPHLDAGDVDELERTIEAGKLPVRYDGVFDEGE